MVVRDCDGNEIKEGTLVVSPRTRRSYSVLKVKPNGRLVLWKHGWPRIRNAVPKNWRLVRRRLEAKHETA